MRQRGYDLINPLLVQLRIKTKTGSALSGVTCARPHLVPHHDLYTHTFSPLTTKMLIFVFI